MDVNNASDCGITCSSNLPSNGTDIEVDGIISAKSKKNTVSDSKMEMERET